MSTTTDAIRPMLAGGLAAGYLVAMLFFFRFWRDTRDRLFLLFGIAFLIFAGQRAALAFGPDSLEDQTPLFLLRLAGYVLILVAIVDRNRRPGSGAPPV
jgi:hypothetical protein